MTTINIDTNKKYESCVEKCSYNFNYPSKTHLKITNRDNGLSIIMR